jgi:hypothetical protein
MFLVGQFPFVYRKCHLLGIFLISTASRLVLGPTKAPVQWVLGALSQGVK